MKIIIVGTGEVGFHIAQKLSEENQDVFLIDKDPKQIKRITENLDVQAILGFGTNTKMLMTPGITDADLLVAATDRDEVNLIACLLARHMNQYILKVARIRNPEYLEEKELGESFHRMADAIKERQAALQESEVRFREIFTAVHEAILIYDSATGDVIGINISSWRRQYPVT